MNVKRSRVALCANMGKLWAIGGYDGESNLSTVSIKMKLFSIQFPSMIVVFEMRLFVCVFRSKCTIRKRIHGHLLLQCVRMAVALVLVLFRFHKPIDHHRAVLQAYEFETT